MKFLLALLAIPLFAAATRITDTIYTPFELSPGNRIPWSGKIDILCPAGKTSGGATIRKWQKTVTVGASGAFDQFIDPGDVGTPLGRYCSVTYRPNSGPVTSASWYVYESVTALKITDVEVLSPQAALNTIIPSQITLANGALIYGANGHGTPLTAPVDGACYGLAYTLGVPTFTACAGGAGPWTRTGTNIAPTVPTDTVSIGTTVLAGGLVIVATGSPYNCVADNSTDNKTCIDAALSALATAGGGTLYFPPAALPYFTTPFTIPNTGDNSGRTQKRIRLTGGGAGYTISGEISLTVPASSALRFGSTAQAGKIVSLGMGELEIDRIALLSTDSSSTVPFIYVTMTSLLFHDAAIVGGCPAPIAGAFACTEDGVVLGGDAVDGAYDGTSASAFGGYHTKIDGVWFNKLARAVWFRSSANGLKFVNNTIWADGGCSTTNCAAVEFSNTHSAPSVSNWISGNLIEMFGYKYGIYSAANGKKNIFVGNNFFDPGSTAIALYKFAAGATDNFILGTNQTSPTAFISEATAGDNLSFNTDNSLLTMNWIWKFDPPNGAFTYFTRGIKSAIFTPICFTGSSNPNAACTANIGQWDTSVLTLDNGTTRSFIPLRYGQSYHRYPVVPRTSATLSATDSNNELITNEGVGGNVNLTLPTTANAVLGTPFTAYVLEAHEVKFTANTGQTIQVGANVTSSAGTVACSTVGCSITIVYVASGKWVATSVVGTWTLT